MIERPQKKQRSFFLFLLPVFFVFHGYVQYWKMIPAADALLLVFFYVTVAAGLWLLFKLFFKSWVKASLYTAFLLCIHFFFGAAHDDLKELVGERFISSYTLLLPVIAVACLLAAWLLRRTQFDFNKTIRFLNLILCVLLLVDAGTLLYKMVSAKPRALPAGLNYYAGDKPDVYLVLADAYSGKKELEDIFGFNNQPFIDSLRQMGFYVYDQPLSNYNYTPFSVASILNLNYLDLPTPANTPPHVPRIMQEIKENKLTRYLAACGYQIFNNSYFDLLDDPTPTAATFLPNKTTYITAQTLLSRLWQDIGFNLVTRYQLDWAIRREHVRSKTNDVLLYERTMKTAANGVHPKFSYTHLMLPHPPYFFDSTGKEYALEEALYNKSNDRYVSYLQYANKKYLHLLKTILQANAQPPVIVFMSDHSSRHTEGGSGRKEYVFYNFVALYFPNGNYQQLPRTITNVNVFRVVLNEVFGQRLPLLKDSTTFLQ